MRFGKQSPQKAFGLATSNSVDLMQTTVSSTGGFTKTKPKKEKEKE